MRGMDGWDTYDKLWRGESVCLCVIVTPSLDSKKEKYVLLKMRKWKYVFVKVNVLTNNPTPGQII